MFKPTLGNESLHEISDDNGFIVVNFAISKSLIVKKYDFPTLTFIDLHGHLLMERHTTKLICVDRH
jgi:hypothetical protein